MARLKVPSLKAFKLFVENPVLGDPSLPSAPIPFSLKEEYSESISDPGGLVGGMRITAGAEVRLAVINDAKDPNGDGFFEFGAGPHAAEDPESAPALEPPVRFEPEKAYMVLGGLSASGRLAGSGEFSSMRVGLDGSAHLTLAACTAFDRDARLEAATNHVCEHFKTPFSLKDLRLLRPEETLMLGFGGTLKLALELSGSCLGDAVAAGLQGVLNRAVPIDLGLAPTATLEITAEITDGYRLYVQRGDAGGEWRFSVRKASSRVLGLDGSVGIRVDLRDGQALARAISSCIAGLTKLPAAFVERALACPEMQELSAEDQGLVEKALDLLKLRDPAVSAWRTFKKALLETEKRALAVITLKITAGLNYTWRRVTADSHAARFTVDAAALEKHHTNILRLNLQPLIDEAKDGASGIKFDRFLGKKMRKVDVGFGFCLALNDFVFLKGWDARTQRYVWLRDLDGRVQVSFLGRRAYEGTWMGRTEGHSVELDASMPRFTPAPVRARDFDLGLHVAFTWRNRRLDSVLLEVADHACLIQATPAGTVSGAAEGLTQGLETSRIHGDATVSLLVPSTAVDGLLGLLAGPDRDELLALALARALPCGEFGLQTPLRNDVSQRTLGYAGLWRGFLRQPEIELAEFARMASRAVEDHDRTLGRNELDTQRLWGWSAHGVLRNFGGTAALGRACDDLRFAVAQLADRAGAASDHRLFERATTACAPMWADHYGARVFASLLILAAQRLPGALERVGRKVSLQWTEAGEDRTRQFKLGDETL